MPKYIDVESAAYDYGTLYDWFISSVGPEPPVWTDGHIEELDDFYVVPKSTPTADVVEVRHGRWEWLSSTYDRTPCEKRYECSVCHHETISHGQDPWENYCPNCGARMDGGQDE